MDYLLDKNSIVLFGKQEKLDTLATKLASLNGKQVYSMFINRGIAVPRKINCLALRSVLNERLKVIHASELSKDYFLRLKYYNDFSEYQLYNLFLKICNTKEDFKKYRINLFKLILMNFVGLNLADGEVNYLKNLKKLTMEKFETYFHYISSMCQEQQNTFDGQDMNKLKEMLVDSSSNQDILNLASKYGLELSLSLKKQELAEVVRYYLQKQGELTKSLETEIDASTVAGLNNLCKKYRIPMSSNMTKTELVNYLFFILEQCEITTTSVRRVETNGMFEPLEFIVDMSAFKGFKPDDTKRVIIYRGFENDEFPPLIKEEAEIVDNSDKPLDFSKNEESKSQEAIADEIKSEAKTETKKKTSSKNNPVKEKVVLDNEESTEEKVALADSNDSIALETTDEIGEEAPTKEVIEEVISEDGKIEEDEPLADGEVIYVDEDGNPIDVEFIDEFEVEENDEDKQDNETSEISEEYIEQEENNEEAETVQTVDEIVEETPVEEDLIEEEVKEASIDESIQTNAESNKEASKLKTKKLPKDDVRENSEYGNDKLMKAANGPGRLIALITLGVLGVFAIIFIIWALLR